MGHGPWGLTQFSSEYSDGKLLRVPAMVPAMRLPPSVSTWLPFVGESMLLFLIFCFSSYMRENFSGLALVWRAIRVS